MKVLDKIILVLFSWIILILSILFCLVIFGWIPVEEVVANLNRDSMTSNIALGTSVVLMLLAIKGIFFISDSETKEESDNGILIQNEEGKLFISKETIQNLVSGVVKEINGVQDISSKVLLTKTNDINIDVVLSVTKDAVITELSLKLQTKIKEIIKQTMNIDIKEVNIQIKNITPTMENS